MYETMIMNPRKRGKKTAKRKSAKKRTKRKATKKKTAKKKTAKRTSSAKPAKRKSAKKRTKRKATKKKTAKRVTKRASSSSRRKVAKKRTKRKTVGKRRKNPTAEQRTAAPKKKRKLAGAALAARQRKLAKQKAGTSTSTPMEGFAAAAQLRARRAESQDRFKAGRAGKKGQRVIRTEAECRELARFLEGEVKMLAQAIRRMRGTVADQRKQIDKLEAANKSYKSKIMLLSKKLKAAARSQEEAKVAMAQLKRADKAVRKVDVIVDRKTMELEGPAAVDRRQRVRTGYTLVPAGLAKKRKKVVRRSCSTGLQKAKDPPVKCRARPTYSSLAACVRGAQSRGIKGRADHVDICGPGAPKITAAAKLGGYQKNRKTVTPKQEQQILSIFRKI